MRSDPWPLRHLRLRIAGLELRPVREDDLATLVEIRPDDVEHDPRPEPFGGQGRDEHRRRLLFQEYWRALGTWSPDAWCLNLVVLEHDHPVGLQTLEADDFAALRTVDSASWLTGSARGRGIGVTMRAAVLGLAFDHLGAQVAISSARVDNHASLGVSRRLGYEPNGLGRTTSADGVAELQHVRLTVERWRTGAWQTKTQVTGLDACRGWFDHSAHAGLGK